MRLFSSALSGGFLLLAACSASTSVDPLDTDNAAVTGVTDLTALEAELGLVKDQANAAGAFSRSDARLHAGSCYKSTLGGANGARYEVRRYTTGAAFFTKLTGGAQAGNKRPIACVDVDIEADVDGNPSVLSLSGLSLDLTMRFHLGKPTGWDAGLGHLYIGYERATVEVAEPDHYCGIVGDSGTRSPGADAFAQAITSCKQHAGTEDACNEQAMNACKKAVAKDVVADTIDRPAFPTTDQPWNLYFYDVQLDPGNEDGNQAYLDASLVSMVYRYAWRVAADRNAFTLTGDPVGKFVSYEEKKSDDYASIAEHARFEKLDAHRTVENGIERLAITPKGSDAKIIEGAIALCTRAVDFDGNPIAAFQCRGL